MERTLIEDTEWRCWVALFFGPWTHWAIAAVVIDLRTVFEFLKPPDSGALKSCLLIKVTLGRDVVCCSRFWYFTAFGSSHSRKNSRSNIRDETPQWWSIGSIKMHRCSPSSLSWIKHHPSIFSSQPVSPGRLLSLSAFNSRPGASACPTYRLSPSIVLRNTIAGHHAAYQLRIGTATCTGKL